MRPAEHCVAAALKSALADLRKPYGPTVPMALGPAHFAFGEHRPFGWCPASRPSSMSRCRARAALHAQPRQVEFRRRTAVRQPRAHRAIGPSTTSPISTLALHPDHRPVRQSLLALLSLVRGALGKGRVHRDSYQARTVLERRDWHVAADAEIAGALVSGNAGL